MDKRDLIAVIAVVAGVTGCAGSGMQLGGPGGSLLGGAGSGTTATPVMAAQGGAQQLAHCAEPIGTIALVEHQNPSLTQLGLTSPVPLIRLMAAQSKCFNVVDRGAGLTRMNDERRLAESGMLRGGSNVGRGQMVAADYLITPNVSFSNNDAGAMGGALGSALGSYVPGMGGLFARTALESGLKYKEAQAVLEITDTRSGVQVGVAEGYARASDLASGLGLASLGGFGTLGGYSNTSQGKVVAGAFLDAFNKLVDEVRATKPAAGR
jgi:curli biogenesis system outer membrane secretion channel CsgG